jgi:hypothetical protein
MPVFPRIINMQYNLKQTKILSKNVSQSDRAIETKHLEKRNMLQFLTELLDIVVVRDSSRHEKEKAPRSNDSSIINA